MVCCAGKRRSTDYRIWFSPTPGGISDGKQRLGGWDYCHLPTRGVCFRHRNHKRRCLSFVGLSELENELGMESYPRPRRQLEPACEFEKENIIKWVRIKGRLGEFDAKDI